MLMIGVMPLPALIISAFAGSGSGSPNSPSTAPRKTCAPGVHPRVKYGDMRPPSTCLIVTLTRPCG